MVHAKLADESQNTQSAEYKYIYFAPDIYRDCIKTFRSLREMSF